MLVTEEILIVPVAEVRLGDVLLETYSVVGIGSANQRGKDARRFDLELLEDYETDLTTSARLIVPIDHQIGVSRAVEYHGG